MPNTTDLNSSIPDLSYHYQQACAKLLESDNSSKLVIGLFSCNLLMTSSCTLSKYPVICVGPSTSRSTPSKNTKIFLHEKSVETADKLFNDKGCSQLYPHDILNQCKQVRSKFYRVETYSSCRCSSHTRSVIYINHILFGHYTTMILHKQLIHKLNSALYYCRKLQKIALNVLESSKNLVDPFIEKKTLESFKIKEEDLQLLLKKC